MTKQEQIKEIDKQSERRINYCVRIQEAFNYKGNYDCEDIPSILVDFEREIKNDILPKDSVVLSRKEYEMLITQYKNLEIKYSNLCDNYRLCKDANETLKQNVIIIRKETAKEIFTEIKSLINNAKEKLPTLFPKNDKYKQGYESSVKHFEKHILELAESSGVEVEE